MTVLVTPDEMLEAERATIAAGTPGDVLMRRAAESIAGWLNRHVPERDSRARRVVGLIGPGNNGGDALVTLGILASRGWGWSCQALTVDRERVGALPMSDAERRGILTIDAPDLESADVILDGVYGVRSRTTLSHDVEALFARVNATRSRRPLAVVAVDVPSGIDAGDGDAAPDAIRADVTLCLGLPKLGLTREPAATLTGDLVLIDIGIPPPAIAGRPRLLSPASVVPFLPRRRATAHKHGAGAVLIVGGAPTYYGAPRLAVEAALRAGAGLVAAAVPAAIVPVLATQVPEAVLVPLAEAEGTAPIERFVDDRRATLHALVVGPGMGRGAFARAMLEGLLGGDAADAIRRLPKVIDADALNWMADLPALPGGVAPGSAVLTPHPGELSRLLGADTTTITADPVAAAREAAARFRQVVILKSGYSPIAYPNGEVWLAQRATPELATAGTGDVLSGLIGGFLAQRVPPMDAARAAIFVGAEAGRRAAWRVGTAGTVARDVISEVGPALSALTEPEWLA